MDETRNYAAQDFDRIAARSTAAAQGFLSDPRRVVGLIILAAGVGLIVGFRLAAGVEPLPVPPPGPFGGPVPQPPHRCRECEEKAIQDAQKIARASAEATTPNVVDPPAPVVQVDPPAEPFDHTKPAASAATFSPLASPAAVPDAPVGVPLDQVQAG